jgi:hypothetical protein
METPPFTDRRYRVTDDGHGVVCDLTAQRPELEALRAALAWRRERMASEPLHDAGAVLAMRALGTLDDRLTETIDAGPPAPLTIDREQAQLLCELAGQYIAERDFDGYTPPEERARIALLDRATGPLMDCVCELLAALQEARAQALIR